MSLFPFIRTINKGYHIESNVRVLQITKQVKGYYSRWWWSLRSGFTRFSVDVALWRGSEASRTPCK